MASKSISPSPVPSPVLNELNDLLDGRGQSLSDGMELQLEAEIEIRKIFTNWGEVEKWASKVGISVEELPVFTLGNKVLLAGKSSLWAFYIGEEELKASIELVGPKDYLVSIHKGTQES